MARFNPRNAVKSTKTVNVGGGVGYAQSSELELASLLLTSFANEEFYRTSAATYSRVRELVQALPDKSFAARAAIFARHEFGMRSITHVCLAELAHAMRGTGSEWIRRAICAGVRRPDDITEILAYYLATFGKPLPNALKRGLGDSFAKFSRYQLAKYKGDGHGMSLRNALRLVHPSGADSTGADCNGDALRLLAKGELKGEDTWEVMLSAAKTPWDRLEVWEQLLVRNQLGYFALLRNLRNIWKDTELHGLRGQGVQRMALDALIHEESIKKALVLPFRFISAYEELAKVAGPLRAGEGFGLHTVLSYIEKAADIALDNVPNLPGATLCVLDNSGSMQGHDNKAPAVTGALFSAVLVKSGADFMSFSDIAQYATVKPGSVLAMYRALVDIVRRPTGTNFHAPFLTANKPYDNIIILSDMQGWQGEYGMYGRTDSVKDAFKDYKVRTGADPKVFMFDLKNYGTSKFPQDSVYCLAGFSDKVFQIMSLLREDRNALVNRIKSVNI
jgi:hypothetical protein